MLTSTLRVLYVMYVCIIVIFHVTDLCITIQTNVLCYGYVMCYKCVLCYISRFVSHI